MGAYGLGSAIAEGILGGVAGAGKAAGEDLAEQQKAAIEALRDQRLAQLAQSTHAANVRTDLNALPERLATETTAKVNDQSALAPGVIAAEQAKSDIAAAAERQKPVTMAPGSTRLTPGTPGSPEIPQGDLDYSDTGEGRAATAGTPDQIYTAPIRTPEEQVKMYEAHAEYYKALARQVSSGGKDKVQLPNVKVEKDPTTDEPTMIDQNSGAIGKITEGAPAVPAVSHWFKPDEPGKPAAMPGVQWSYNGRPLKNGLSDLYPAIQQRTAKAAPGIIAGTAGDSGEAPEKPTAPKPPKAYPDAKLAPDGHWYVKKADGYYKVQD
jgi:hypothetical protein